jgi:hypothetical protein
MVTASNFSDFSYKSATNSYLSDLGSSAFGRSTIFKGSAFLSIKA